MTFTHSLDRTLPLLPGVQSVCLPARLAPAPVSAVAADGSVQSGWAGVSLAPGKLLAIAPLPATPDATDGDRLDVSDLHFRANLAVALNTPFNGRLQC